jgi:hypothetical protein
MPVEVLAHAGDARLVRATNIADFLKAASRRFRPLAGLQGAPAIRPFADIRTGVLHHLTSRTRRGQQCEILELRKNRLRAGG